MLDHEQSPTEALTQENTSTVEGQVTEQNKTPDMVPYNRLQEVVQEKNELKALLQEQQQQSMLLQQYLQQVIPQQTQQPSVDPNEYWAGADTDPVGWQNKRIMPLVDQLVEQKLNQAFQTYQANQVMQNAVHDAMNKVSSKYQYFNNPITQAQLHAAAQYLDRTMPKSASVEDVFMKAAEEITKSFGVGLPNTNAVRAVSEDSGNLMPSNNVDDLTAQKQIALQKKDATALAQLAIQNLNNRK